ncbi:glutamine-dependent NAD(+) synthetase [Entomophthora muscae]|uniref:Glutamine-dependent NAD(+) synthetase n=1 Tax=Entomophthora muscae TaxID=34485 RepID=A0ACC2UHZ7_9FUNG|nr:glutamine-dependent NAD(+) synthetase [Entomophthora muscae]
MGHLVVVATCALNQWSLDFDGNLNRIVASIKLAKAKGAGLRIGPELEITGYGCQDHFLEGDTYLHAWESIGVILADPELHGIIIDIGMPIRHKNVNYNCRVLCLDGKILLIRPKQWLANDGNYREMRWFSPWSRPQELEDHALPRMIRKITSQDTVPFGDGVISTLDTCIGVEMCEELFTPNSPHIHMGLDGVEIFTNGSGSHHELRKLHTRIELVQQATTQSGGVYLYANQQGCDGDRLYYDGCAMVALNGKLMAQGSQFSIQEVEVITCVIDLEEVRTYRGTFRSRCFQATRTPRYPRIQVDFALSSALQHTGRISPTVPLAAPRYHTPSEEISLGPACWLWDYLRRSRLSGFFLPLSGGLDSCATATIVCSMCHLVVAACINGDEQAIQDARMVSGLGPDSDYIPADPREFANRIFHTAYMGTDYSGKATRARAAKLADEIGSYHLDFNMDAVISAILTLFSSVTSRSPRFATQGGTSAENLALQNIQARLRMLLGYLFAQLLPWCRGLPRAGGLLVLGSANVDECLRGYFTKYDCSSADLNPIGSISKQDLRSFLEHAHSALGLECLPSFLSAMPSAELIPTSSEAEEQSDELEMGMSYAELSVFGRLRQVLRLGPYGMTQRLLSEWPLLSPSEIGTKVKRFFFYYAINRHKMTTLTPAYHAEAYSPDDHRFDHRPFLYPSSFSRQFRAVDTLSSEVSAE